MNIGDILNGGQARTRWLNSLVEENILDPVATIGDFLDENVRDPIRRPIAEALQPFVPPNLRVQAPENMPSTLEAMDWMNPVADIRRAGQSAETVFDPAVAAALLLPALSESRDRPADTSQAIGPLLGL